MESPYYEMTHDFEEENRLFQSGYIKGYHDAVMRCSNIVRCKDCQYGFPSSHNGIFCSKATYFAKYKDPNWFCADGKSKSMEVERK